MRLFLVLSAKNQVIFSDRVENCDTGNPNENSSEALVFQICLKNEQGQLD
jgi:hypothetical protein